MALTRILASKQFRSLSTLNYAIGGEAVDVVGYCDPKAWLLLFTFTKGGMALNRRITFTENVITFENAQSHPNCEKTLESCPLPTPHSSRFFSPTPDAEMTPTLYHVDAFPLSKACFKKVEKNSCSNLDRLFKICPPPSIKVQLRLSLAWIIVPPLSFHKPFGLISVRRW